MTTEPQPAHEHVHDHSQPASHDETPTDPTAFWEHHYAGPAPVWSGRVNASLSRVAADLSPGSALDLGCGEGGDAIWLAQHGWQVTGVDISPTALTRARGAAEAAHVTEQVRWLAADLAVWPIEGADAAYDLVSASFLHSPVSLPRGELLRRAAGLVAPGGHLLIIGHAAPPAGTEAAEHHAEHTFLGPEEELAELALAPEQWQVERAERHSRTGVVQGTSMELEDVVVLVRRR